MTTAYLTSGSQILIVAISMAFGGCGVGGSFSSKPSNNNALTAQSTEAPQIEPEPDYITRIRDEAQKRGLKWSVYCYSGKHWGVADYPDSKGYYIEDGAKPRWIFTDSSEVGVANKLYAGIHGLPTHYPEHKPKPEPKEDLVQCREYSGSPQ